jgi:hypothetical protein
MMTLVDNDILLKCACYRLLAELVMASCWEGRAGYLTVARFVLLKRIRRLGLCVDTAVVEADLLGFLAEHAALETTAEEQSLAATMEALAQSLLVNLDTGESQLVAMLALRALPGLLTGDKRAVVAIEQLIDLVGEIVGVGGKVTCLEQLVRRAVATGDAAAIRRAICSEPAVDRTLSICFECSSPEQSGASVFEGLDSYISDLRLRAPRTLSI